MGLASDTDTESGSTNTTTTTTPATPPLTWQQRLHQYRPATGWIAFSLVFNIMNTIVFSTLYPKVLEGIAPKEKYIQAFSTINFCTTLASAGMMQLSTNLSINQASKYLTT